MNQFLIWLNNVIYPKYLIYWRWVEVPKPNPLDAEESESSSNDLMELDEIDNWPYQRYGHTVSAHGKYIYLFGGRNDNFPCNTLFVFDTQSYKWSRPSVTGDIPAARDGHSSCVIDNCMYIFGGYEETNYQFGLDVYRFIFTFEILLSYLQKIIFLI